MDVTVIIGILVAVTLVLSVLLIRQRSSQKPTVASSVVQASRSGAKQEEETPQILFLYGSQTGTAEGYAGELAEDAEEYGLVARTVDLEEFDPEEITGDKPPVCVFLMATYGEGDPTDNAIQFMDWLKENQSEEDLTNLKFTVFALGNRQYENFNFAGINTDKFLEKRGAKRVYKLGMGDDDQDLEADFAAWREDGLWQAICDALNVECKTSGVARAKPGSQWEIQEFPPGTSTDNTCKPNPTSRQYDHVYPYETELLENTELFTSDRSCRHIRLTVPKSVRYHTGDHLGILPENSNEVVTTVAKRLNLDVDAVVSLGTTASAKSRNNKVPFKGKWTLGDVLRRCPDLTHTVSASTIHLLAMFSTDETEKAELERMSGHTPEGKVEYNEKIHKPLVSFVEVLQRYPSITLSLAELLAVCPRLQVRYYSICSSHKKYSTEIHLCVAVVVYEKPDGRMHYGIASTYLQSLSPNAKLRAFVRKSTFHPPLSSKTPMILIGPGTGVAPFLGFIQDREHMVATGTPLSDLGPCELYYGCRYKEKEFLYPEELTKAAESKIISNLHLAFSRDSSERTYVQHVLKKNGAEVWKLLERGAYIYVCGLVEMSKDVIEVLRDIIQTESGMERADAEKFWAKLRSTNRFKTDVWS